MKEKINKSNYKFPRLTKEEFEFFRQKDVSLWKKYGVNWTMQRKIGSALQGLAVKKLLGFGGFEKNKEEAIKHHLKACRYNPLIVRQFVAFRKEVGLLEKNNIDFWAEDMIDRKDDIFLKFQERMNGMEDYIFIKKEYKKGSIQNNLQFQKVYKRFYVMNIAGLTTKFFEEYFKMLFHKETSLKKILNKLHEIKRRNGTNSVQFAFATKLLHTVNNDLPIYDKHVAKFLCLKVVGNNKEDKIDSCIDIYSQLKEYYKKFLNNTLMMAIVLSFREKFKYNKRKMSDTKVIDFIIWARGQLDA